MKNSLSSRFGLSPATLKILLGVTFGTLCCSVLVAYEITVWHEERFRNAQQQKMEHLAFQIEHFLLHHIADTSQQLAELPVITQLATGLVRPDTPEVLTVLHAVQALLNAQSPSIVYVMDSSGLVIASTFDGNGQTLTGHNYRFRPYFTGALSGESVIYPALGTTTNKRGFYFSSPVRAEGTKPPCAVVVVKVELDQVDHLFEAQPYPLALLSPEGVVFATNQPAWLYHTALPLAPEKRLALRDSKQFADQPISPLPFQLDEEAFSVDGIPMVPFFYTIDPLKGWRLVSLIQRPTYPYHAALFFLGGLWLTAFLTGLSILNIKQKRQLLQDLRRRHDELNHMNQQLTQEIAERKWAEKQLISHHQQLETLVNERTEELVTTNSKLEQEIAEHILAKKTITTTLREKEALLKEVHHRVKNNLQTISSLLKLQARKTKDPDARQALAESQNRIQVMSLIHEKIYRTDDLAAIPMADYIKSLAHNLFRIYQTDKPANIHLHIDADPAIKLDISSAIPCGLIINELLSNSLKYAFPTDREGTISIQLLQPTAATYRITICDDGVGLAPGLDFRKTDSLGLHLVVILAEDQLEGEIDIDQSKGTCFRIHFKEKTHV